MTTLRKLRKKARNKRRFSAILRGIACFITGLAGLGLIYLLGILFCFSSFRIPTESMQPTLLPGDYILVQKISLGPRLFNVLAALDGKKVSISRLPGWGKIRHNDVLVFNFPLSPDWNKIEFDVMHYFAKRCIALPGDTLEVRDSQYRVRGLPVPLGDVEQQQAVRSLNLQDLDDGIAWWNPRETRWNLHEAGPLWIPAKGCIVSMNPFHARLYRRLIEWEQQSELVIRADTVLLSGRPLSEYCFQENYYFMAGDAYMNSMDSRYWGLVPEEFIVGKAFLIWRSLDPHHHTFRWERFMKPI